MDKQTVVRAFNGMPFSNESNELLTPITTWINLKSILLSKRSQMKRLHTYNSILLMLWDYRDGKQKWLPVIEGVRERAAQGIGGQWNRMEMWWKIHNSVHWAKPIVVHHWEKNFPSINKKLSMRTWGKRELRLRALHMNSITTLKEAGVKRSWSKGKQCFDRYC